MTQEQFDYFMEECSKIGWRLDFTEVFNLLECIAEDYDLVYSHEKLNELYDKYHPDGY